MNRREARALQGRTDLPVAIQREVARVLAPRRDSPARNARKKAKRDAKAERFERLTKIRDEVFARAAARCEAWRPVLSASENPRGFRCDREAAILDHWEGGNGRRQQHESAETCWALCVQCNSDRTHNWPNADWWNMSRELHCVQHGHKFTPHITRHARSAGRGE